MALSALARVALASALASVAAAGAAETAAAAVASQERADSAASNSANKLVTADLSEGKFKEAAAHFWAASNKASVHTTTAMTKALADFAAWLETEGGQVSLVEAQAAAEAADATPASTAAATDAAAADAQSKAGSQTAAATQGVATTLSLTTDAQDAAIKRLKAAYEQAGGGMDGAGALLGEANDVLSVVNAYALQAISSGVVKDKAEIAERAKAAESFDDKASVDGRESRVPDEACVGDACAHPRTLPPSPSLPPPPSLRLPPSGGRCRRLCRGDGLRHLRGGQGERGRRGDQRRGWPLLHHKQLAHRRGRRV